MDSAIRTTIAGPAPRPTSRLQSRLYAWAGPTVGAVVALVLVAPAFGGRPPAGEDVMSHLVRADFGIAHLVSAGRLDGWFPRFVLGHQEFLFNGPGLTWLMALIRAVTGGTLSNTGALKVVCIASVVALPPAVAFLARSYGLSRRAAGLSAVLCLMVSNPYGPGLQGLFGVGLVPHQVGALLFCVALGAAVRLLSDGSGVGGHPRTPGHGEEYRPRRWVVLAATSLAGLVVTHLISFLVLGVVLAVTVVARSVVRRLSPAGLGRLFVSLAGAAGLAGFWLAPLVGHHDLHGVVTTWGTPPFGQRLGDIVAGRILLPRGFVLLMVAGWAFELCRLRRRPAALAWVVAPLAYLAVAHGALRLLGPSDLTLQLSNRGLGYAGLLGVLAVGALAAAVSRRGGRAGHAAALAVAAAAVLLFAPDRSTVGQSPEPVPEMRDAAAVLRRLVPDGARFATQRDFPGEIARSGTIHPEIWLARASGRNSLNGFNLESVSTSRAAFEPDRLDELPPARSADHLARLGVTHVVTTSDQLAGTLAASGRYTREWHASPLTILSVRARPGAPPPASLVSAGVAETARLVTAGSEHLTISLDAPQPGSVTVALAWSPKWHGHLNDLPVPLRATADGLVRVDLPTGPHLLTLDYRSDSWDRAGVAITLLTVLVMVGAGAVRRRQVMSRIFSRTA